MQPVQVGYWRSREYQKEAETIWGKQYSAPSDLPWPIDLVDHQWHGTYEWVAVMDYLHLRPPRVDHTFGLSTCRICKSENGSDTHCDGAYYWPEGYIHYVRDHHVKPPQDFIDHCVDMVEPTVAIPEVEIPKSLIGIMDARISTMLKTGVLNGAPREDSSIAIMCGAIAKLWLINHGHPTHLFAPAGHFTSPMRVSWDWGISGRVKLTNMEVSDP